MELLREVGRLKINGGTADEKASGVKNVAPFLVNLRRRDTHGSPLPF